jgi:hypothetical protein
MAKRRLETNISERQASVALAGDPKPLADRLGSTEGLIRLAQAAVEVPWRMTGTRKGWQFVLGKYCVEVLIPLEWPAILEAHRFTSSQQVRELIDVDHELGKNALWQDSQETSARIGQLHLSRLRSLKDQRVVQRYLDAVGRGEAKAWHPVVYGLILAVYCVPLRQGILHYSWISLFGRFLQLNPSHIDASESSHAALEPLFAKLPDALNQLLNQKHPADE